MQDDEQDLNAAPPVLGIVILALVSAVALTGWLDLPVTPTATPAPASTPATQPA